MRKMKKYVIVMAALLTLSMTLWGCGSSDPTTGTSAGQEVQQQSVGPEVSKETYRNVKVLELTGAATLTRAGTQMEVYVDLLLQGGDRIVTAEDSMVALQLDDDKYLLIQEHSDVTFELEGNPEKGAIRLHLAQGSIHNEIQNPLAEGDCYEVHTPDGVMAVRGTEFAVEVTTASGIRTVHVEVESGKVQITVLNETGEEVLLEAGEEAEILRQLEELTGDGEDGQPQLLTEGERICPVCKEIVDKNAGHKRGCGHYICENGKTHKKLECGHWACKVSGSHGKVACGIHYSCASGEHSVAACGKHYLCEGGDHAMAECGEHYACEAGDHTMQFCEDWGCDGRQHVEFACGCRTCGSDPVTACHSILNCGVHYECSWPPDLVHEACTVCGLWICENEELHPNGDCLRPPQS